MKNEIELNIHLFFPEQRNDEISAEQHKALETLLALPELDQEDSVEKFIAELESRLALIKPILGDQTEEFLGYNQDDITKLADFFAGKFKRFGMDAARGQYILRSIWLKTPREDMRLNYKLYKVIDETFYSIVNERKASFSFDDNFNLQRIKEIENRAIDWDVLVLDWEIRKNQYGSHLEVPEEYFSEFSGDDFPSASGLFANPAPPKNTDCSILEFLNFWMPHLKEGLFKDILVSTAMTIDYKCEKKCSDTDKLIYISYLKYINKALDLSTISWIVPYKKCFKSLLNVSNNADMNNFGINNNSDIRVAAMVPGRFFSKSIPRPDINNHADVAYLEEEAWYKQIEDFYNKALPSKFFLKTKKFDIAGCLTSNSYFSTLDHGEDIYSHDEVQLPHFINACCEYVMSEGKIKKSECLRFYKGKKIYFPSGLIYTDDLIRCADAYDAAKVELPDFADGIQTVADYYDKVFLKMDGLEYSPLQWPECLSILKCESGLDRENIFYYRATELFRLIIKWVNFYAEDYSLSPSHRLKVMATIKKYFSSSRNLGKNLADYIDREIDKLVADNDVDKQQAISFALANEINYFYQLQELERRNIELARMRERIDFFNNLCHEMGGLSTVVKSRIDDSQERLLEVIPPINEKTLMHLNVANQGAYILSQYTRTFTLSARKLDDNWRDDLNSTYNAKKMRDILWQAFNCSISHVFFRDITRFFHACVSQNYFATKAEMIKAKDEWGNLDTRDDQLAWIQQYLFNFTWQDDAVALDTMIGDKHFIQTHLFVLFYEIFLNAIKAISYVEKTQRNFIVNFGSKNGCVFVEMCNSLGEESLDGHGQGNLIIKAYMDKFNITDFNAATDSENSIYAMSFSLPFLSKGEK